MSVRINATHLYSFQVGCSCISPIACTSISGFVCLNSLSIESLPALLDEVDEREDRDPDNVDEVPVERRDVDEKCVLRLQPALDVDREERQQPEHARGDVRAVEAREREERRAEQVGSDRQSLVHERRELERLKSEK